MKNDDRTVNEIRKFNRFYTVHMGFLDLGYLDSDYSIAETRILFEIKMRETCIQSDIVKILRIDKSYLSRLIGRLCKKGLIEKTKAENDKRAFEITLTATGHMETDRLIALTNSQIELQIKELDTDEREKLCHALNTVTTILGKGNTLYEHNTI